MLVTALMQRSSEGCRIERARLSRIAAQVIGVRGDLDPRDSLARSVLGV